MSDEETLALLKNQFVAEVKEIMKNFISIRSQKLFQSETTSAPNLFLNQTTLAQIYGDATTAVTHTLTATEKSNLIADINKILEIESELKKEVQKTMSEQTKYSFFIRRNW